MDAKLFFFTFPIPLENHYRKVLDPWDLNFKAAWHLLLVFD
jgi:hypothetical protein